jgi:hypothetical protein
MLNEVVRSCFRNGERARQEQPCRDGMPVELSTRLQARLAKHLPWFEIGLVHIAEITGEAAQRVTTESHQWGCGRALEPSQTIVSAARAMRTPNECLTCTCGSVGVVYLRATSTLLRCS